MITLISYSIAQTESLEDYAAKTGLLLEYIKRGMCLGCFYYARCLQTGKGVQKNEEEAKKYFNKVFVTHIFSCYQMRIYAFFPRGWKCHF